MNREEKISRPTSFVLFRKIKGENSYLIEVSKPAQSHEKMESAHQIAKRQCRC